MIEGGDLDALEGWIGGIMARLEPQGQLVLSRRIGQFLRRTNAARVKKNITPDGHSMIARKRPKKIKDRKGRVGKTMKMFPRIEMARNLGVYPGYNQVAVGFNTGKVNHVAKTHHYGMKRDYVRHSSGKPYSVKYPERPLLGFGPEDEAAIMEYVMEWLGDWEEQGRPIR